MIDPQINPIHTPCKNCVFAIYDDKTQTDCAIHYIDKFKQKNISVLEAYDADKEFYIINGKKCIGYRENKWFEQFGLADSSLDNKIEKYYETNHLDYLIAIDLKSMNMDNLKDLFKQISECTIQPRKVVLIRYADNELKFPYTDIEHIIKNHKVSYTWRIQTILDLSLSYDEILHNIITLNPRIRFVVSVPTFNNSISHVVSYTNQLVHHDLDQFDVISNQDHSCIIFSNISYRFEAIQNKKNLLKNTDSYRII